MVVAMLLGAKGAALNDNGRAEEALPVLERSLTLLEATSDGSPEDMADVALALSSLGVPYDRALTDIVVLRGGSPDVTPRQ